ncbi:MAG: nucleotide exchange factor GrpE [candidate division WOR-3 bacterium]
MEEKKEIMNSEEEKPKEEVKEEDLVTKLQKEKEELKDKYLRALANYENLRKRAIEEKEKIYSFAIEEVFRKVLPILDDFNRAFKHLEDSKGKRKDYKSFVQGVRLIKANIEALLRNYNIEAFKSVGEKFDYSKHEAIQVIETALEEDDKILEEIETGYKIGDKILRPAKVIVAKKLEIKEEKNGEEGRKEGGDGE